MSSYQDDVDSLIRQIENVNSWIWDSDDVRSQIHLFRGSMELLVSGSLAAGRQTLEDLQILRDLMVQFQGEDDFGEIANLLDGWQGGAASMYAELGPSEFPQIWANQIEYLDGLIANVGGQTELLRKSRQISRDIARAAIADGGSEVSTVGRFGLILAGAVVAGGVAAALPASGGLSTVALGTGLEIVGNLISGMGADSDDGEIEPVFKFDGDPPERLDQAFETLRELIDDHLNFREQFRSNVILTFNDINPANITIGQYGPVSSEIEFADRNDVSRDIGILQFVGDARLPYLVDIFYGLGQKLGNSIDGTGGDASSMPRVPGGEQLEYRGQILVDAINSSAQFLDTLAANFRAAAADFAEIENVTQQELEGIISDLEEVWNTHPPDGPVDTGDIDEELPD